jgi:NADH oxidase (H2O2-forming)
MRIVIVGNGAAGNEAAVNLRKLDSHCEIVMLARESYPAYSACALPDVLAGWIPLKQTFLLKEEDYARLKIERSFGQAVNKLDLSEKCLQTAETVYHYDRLILVTGSQPVIPAVPGSDLAGNFVVKTPGDIERILAHKPKQVVVVGAGNIGVETASALRNRGCRVSLVEMKDRIMPLLYDQKPSALIQKILEEGIEVLTGERVSRISGDTHIKVVHTQGQDINADTVIWAAGVRQNTDIAREAGLSIGSLGGIQVDTHMQSSEAGVFACGDCVESFQVFTRKPCLSLLWSSAKRQAQVAARNCLGYLDEYEGSCSLLIEDIMGIPCVAMGLNLEALQGYEVEVIEQQDENEYFRILMVEDRIVGFQAIGKVEGSGAIFTMIKKGTPVSESRKVLLNRRLVPNLAWYIDSSQYLSCSN